MQLREGVAESHGIEGFAISLSESVMNTGDRTVELHLIALETAQIIAQP
jgi:hypothetical protein